MSDLDTTIRYTGLLEIYQNLLSKAQKETIESEVYEIIGDELNHQDRLKSLYSLVTSIKEQKD